MTAGDIPAATALVVGAGPGGLSAAIALTQAGLDVEVVEARTDLRTRGSELMLAGGLLRALRTLGAARGCAERGWPVHETQLFGADGGLLAALPLPRLAGDDLPPAVGITRPWLHAAMADAAEAAGIRLRAGVAVTAIAQDADGVDVTLDDGGRERHDLVVAADGGRSPLRGMLCLDEPPARPTGQSVWRARAPRTMADDALGIWFGPRSKAGALPIAADAMYLFLVVNHTEHIPRAQRPALLQEALADFGGAVAEARPHLTDPDDIYLGALESSLMRPPWHRGRVVFVGDAAHATTPHLAYGAGIAVEDGLVLARSLAGAADLQTGLDAYVARRWERCRMVVENCVQLGEWEQHPEADADPAALIDASWRELAGAI